MAYTPYSTHTMMGVVRHLPKPSTFWLNLLFRQQMNFESEYIDFDDVFEGRRVAPFVAPTVQGKVMKEQGFTTKRFKPAYLKPKHVLDSTKLLSRSAGEPYTGQLTPAQRRNANMASLVRTQRDMIIRRWEIMAAEAALDGQVTVEGDDYPRVVVDFGRSNNNEATLTGTDLWTDQSNSKPLKNMDEWSKLVARSSGYHITDWVFGLNAWEAFKDHPATEKVISNMARNGNANLDLGLSEIPDDGAIVQLRGTMGAGVRVWTYSDIYEDDSGSNVEIMDPDTILGVNPAGFQGVRCFGAIMDAMAGYMSTDIFSKNWMENDPSVEYIMSQSAPLMVPKGPNATFKATVV